MRVGARGNAICSLLHEALHQQLDGSVLHHTLPEAPPVAGDIGTEELLTPAEPASIGPEQESVTQLQPQASDSRAEAGLWIAL
eukprot:5813633-Alexandrium_andersonii.AAC.1